MEAIKLKWIVFLLFAFYVSGCATVSPLGTHFENNFSDYKVSKKDIINKASFKKSYQNSYDEVWSNVLKILSQYAIIIDISKESGTISYIDIDGVFFSNVFTKDKFAYWEFPFTIWVEKQPPVTIVNVYPMTDFFEKYSKRKWWRIVEKGFNQKAEEFLENLSTQLEAKERWQWLRK